MTGGAGLLAQSRKVVSQILDIGIVLNQRPSIPWQLAQMPYLRSPRAMLWALTALMPTVKHMSAQSAGSRRCALMDMIVGFAE